MPEFGMTSGSDTTTRRPLTAPLRAAVGALVVLASSFFLFLLWDGTLDPQVLAASLASALVAAAIWALVATKEKVRLHVDVAAVRSLAAAVVHLPAGARRAAVFFVAVLRGKRRRGSARCSPLDVKLPGRSQGAGNHAAIVLAECIAPDSVVVDLKDEM